MYCIASLLHGAREAGGVKLGRACQKKGGKPLIIADPGARRHAAAVGRLPASL
jgi:hypothetical protein